MAVESVCDMDVPSYEVRLRKLLAKLNPACMVRSSPSSSHSSYAYTSTPRLSVDSMTFTVMEVLVALTNVGAAGLSGAWMA